MADQPYDGTAHLYDPFITKGIPYDDLAGLITAQIKTWLPQAERVLDVACGTGNLTLPLAKQGYQLTGLDLSSQMLAIARTKTLEAGLTIDYLQQDMTQPYGVGDFDVVTCFFGGINHLLSVEALQACFQQIYAALKPGGLFIFEQFSPAKMRSIFSTSKAEDFGPFFLYAQDSCDAKGHIIHNMLYFIRDADGRYTRIDELHEYFIFSFETVKATLTEIGFELKDEEELYKAIPTAWMFKDVFLFVAQRPLTT